jgi:hypothetical protein
MTAIFIKSLLTVYKVQDIEPTDITLLPDKPVHISHPANFRIEQQKIKTTKNDNKRIICTRKREKNPLENNF